MMRTQSLDQIQIEEHKSLKLSLDVDFEDAELGIYGW
jgi:hypothetical protein